MIYFDHNATTPIAPEVREVMEPYLSNEWGNASSSYRFGSQLKGVVEKARGNVAALLGAHGREIVFTSCATESSNTALWAALRANPEKRHIVTSKVEHSAVLAPCQALEHAGYRVTYLGVDYEGLIDLNELQQSIGEETTLVSMMWANNETGVIFPVEEIGAMCRERGVLFHCDAAQAVGKMPIDLAHAPIDYLSLAGHKINAPKGVGALYVHRQAPFTPLLHGGHQEKGRRGGTENIAFIAALGEAAALAQRKLANYNSCVRPLRDALERGITTAVPCAELNGHPSQRLANTCNLTFNGIEAEALLLLLDMKGICASSGSACLADSEEPSHVVSTMKPELKERQTVRFSLAMSNTMEEVEAVVSAVRQAVETLR